MSNPANVLGATEFDGAYRQKVQDALDLLYGLIQKSQGAGAGTTTFDELRVKKLTVLGTVDVVPEDKPPANEFSRLLTPWLTGQRGRGMHFGFEDQNDSGDLMAFRWQPYLIGSPTATTGDWELAGYSAQRDPAGAHRRLGAIRFGQDGRIRVYDATEVLQFDSTTVLTASELPTRYVEGLVIRYASSSTITVSAGKARDKADGADMTLASQVTVSTGTANAALGYERKSLTGTHTLNFGTGAVTGSGSAYYTEFGTRALTGTISNSSNSVTGVGTAFLSEVAVNDLIGNSTSGYYRVASIESNTGLTIVAGGPGGVGKTDFSGSAANVIEQPIIESAAGKAHGLSYITSNTALLMNITTASATETGVAAYASSKAALDSASYTCLWRAVWLLSGGSGTTVALSTQRTTPYLSTSGYTTSYRRIGWVRINSSGNVVPIDSLDSGGASVRESIYRANTNIVANASSPSGSATGFTCEAACPPTARAIFASSASITPNTQSVIVVQPRGTGVAGGTTIPLSARDHVVPPAGSTSNAALASYSGRSYVTCDGAQGLEHWAPSGTTGDGTYVSVNGWEEDLE